MAVRNELSYAHHSRINTACSPRLRGLHAFAQYHDCRICVIRQHPSTRQMLRRSGTAITTTLLLAGAISGAIAGMVAITAATLMYLLTLPSAALLGLGAGVGAIIGTVSLPVLAWAFLRHVPLRAAIIGTGIGTALGGTAGLLLGASAVNPYVPFSIFLPPFLQCAVGGVLGAACAAGGTHAYFRRQARIRAHAG